MELLLFLAGFYALHCVAYLPAEATAFLIVLGRVRVVRGGGLRPLHPRPSARCPVLAGLPFELRDDGLVARGSLRRIGVEPGPVAARFVSWEELRTTEAAGTLLRVGGRRFARAASKRQASQLCSLLRDACGHPESFWERIGEYVRRSLSPDLARDAEARARDATRVLGWLCDAYGVLLFAVSPVLSLLFAEQVALILPPVLLLHALCVVESGRAHARIFPGLRGERAELLVAAGLFPPALLRFPQELVRSAGAAFHPFALGADLLPDEQALAWFRRELALLEHRRETPLGLLASLEREALLDAASRRGFEAERIQAPRERTDPLSASYCPVCLDDFRAGFSTCPECGVATRPYAS